MSKPAPSRYLGHLDAARDTLFAQHFVDSRDLKKLLTPRSNVIYGSKGAGKTALRRALTELNSSYYFSTITINLNSLSFAQVYQALTNLQATSDMEIASLARTVWRNALVLYALEAANVGLGDQHPTSELLKKTLQGENFTGKTSNARLLGVIERIFRLLGGLGLKNAETGTLPLALGERHIDLTSRAFMTGRIENVLAEVRVAVEKAGGGRPILVCLDGFDSIVDHTEESRTAVFAGLIDSVFRCAGDEDLVDFMCVKAFLPLELTHEARTKVWDADKYLPNTHQIRWSVKDFQRFLLPRMAPITHNRKKSTKFLEVWHEFMPPTIRNPKHGVEEASFEYILRHTLYRPRQLLYQVQKILDEWDDRSNTFRVDPAFIPPVVARTNYELAEVVANQLEVKHPGTRAFLQSWSGSPNVIGMEAFKDRVQRYFGCDSAHDIERVLNDLYTTGMFGTTSESIANATDRRTEVVFAFVGDLLRLGSSDGIDLVALSPMLHEFCGCKPSDYGAIVPVGA